MPTTAHSNLALVTHLLLVTHKVRQCMLTDCIRDTGDTSQQQLLYVSCCETVHMPTTEGCAK